MTLRLLLIRLDVVLADPRPKGRFDKQTCAANSRLIRSTKPCVDMYHYRVSVHLKSGFRFQGVYKSRNAVRRKRIYSAITVKASWLHLQQGNAGQT